MTLAQYHELLLTTSERGQFPSRIGNRCRYLCGDGRNCPIGLVLPDDLAHKLDLEYGTVDSFWHMIAPHMPEGMTRAAARKIQQAHDQLAQWPFWDHDKFAAAIWKLFRGLNWSNRSK